MAAITTDGRVSVFTGADGKPTMPQLNADGSLPMTPTAAPLPTGAATYAEQTALRAIVGTTLDAPTTDFTAAATLEALIKGIGFRAARKERIVFCELTRTADAYTYAPTQVWRAAASGFDTFNAPVGLVNGDAVEILRARLIKSTPVVAGAAFSCYLHTQSVNYSDKAVMNLAYSANAKRAAKIDFPFMQIEGAASDCAMGWGFFPPQTEKINAICDPADTMLYPVVVVEGPYVATASEKLYLELTVR